MIDLRLGAGNPEAISFSTGEPHCAYCKAGFDRTAETGGKTFIHILTRGADGQILKWRPCNRAT